MMPACTNRFRGAQQGLGLIELMIALVLGLVLVLGVVQVFLASHQTFDLQQRTSTLQEDARFVLSRLSSELRMINMHGCLDLTRLPTPARDAVPAELQQPIRFDAGVLRLVTADLNNEIFEVTTQRAVSNYGAQWLIATNCRDELRIAGSGTVEVMAGDILIPIRQLEYRLDSNRLQLRSNAAGHFETLIEGVAGWDVSFGLAGSADEPGVEGHYVDTLTSSDYGRIRSVRLGLQLSDSPGDLGAARVKTREFSLVVALRNRIN
ncbi:PilW family protein [Halopseudomonas salegens]|uniref:Type IV pilus assembly protein PilW n=1 Tax=Halopseudomonas salegens TaxID=1434072 RepID=A0A1H2GLB8_9GAMM|nr:prepilin-type N-terminal cleavage/methylation domain-containing protein [Halopseudomonas salegens]SDU20466.1 type IV pilus assembly protein PilW [Halopseudomonas salegens]